MLGLALTLMLLFSQGRRSQECCRFAEPEPVVGRPGERLRLHPKGSREVDVARVQWKVQLRSTSPCSVMIIWKEESGLNWKLGHLKERLSFTMEGLTLLIKAAEKQDSGMYVLEVTRETGRTENHCFNVSVFDPVGKVQLLQHWETVDGGVCQVTLSCLVSGGDDLSYAWYRGSKQILKNLSRLKEQINVSANGLNIYTCNVSNPVSWANRTLELSQGCQDTQWKLGFLPLLLIVMILVLILFLGALTFFCLWRKKRKTSQPHPEEALTIYADVNNLRIGNNQEQRQASPGNGNTIYSMIQPQSSTAQESSPTLYSVVLPSRKPGSKKRNRNSFLNYTVYEEVGRI